jgi:hypothetical protein
VSPPLPRGRAALAVATLLTALAVAATPASADEASAYLTRTTPLIGPCGGTWFRTTATGLTADPNNWHSNATFVRTDGGGDFETQVYRENGVNRFDRGIACTSSSRYRQVDSPTRYVHRFIYQNWFCDWGSCQYLYTNKGGWLTGL